MALIRFENVEKSFGDHTVLKGVSFKVAPGDVHFLMGGSGAGKSVIIKHIVGLLSVDAGKIWVEDQEITHFGEKDFHHVRKRCQLIFQHATLFDSMTVLENVSMPIQKRFKVSTLEAQQRAHQALDQVHAAAVGHRFPPELGAGVKKRIAIARAIALQPHILLYDEPTTGLDPVAARRTDRLIKEMAENLGITSVVVSHDLDSVRGIADRITFLHQGTILFDGTYPEMEKSSQATLRSFVDTTGTRWRYPSHTPYPNQS